MKECYNTMEENHINCDIQPFAQLIECQERRLSPKHISGSSIREPLSDHTLWSGSENDIPAPEISSSDNGK